MFKFRVSYRFFLSVSLLTIWIVSSCRTGTEPIHDAIKVQFPKTDICAPQPMEIHFENVSNKELLILGVKVEGAPDSPFLFTSVIIGLEEKLIPHEGRIGISDLHIPPQTSYTFIVTYTPKHSDEKHTDIFDIAYQEPQGIVQVALSGESENKAPCGTSLPTTGGGSEAPSIELKGDMKININRIALVTRDISIPITTDQDSTVTLFKPASLKIRFETATHNIFLPAITPDDQFILPASNISPLNDLITGSTQITSSSEAKGVYTDDGIITVNDVPIHLQECFDADILITLTTQPIPRPAEIGSGIMESGKFSLSPDESSFLGAPVNFKTGEVRLIGFSHFKNATPRTDSCSIVNNLKGNVPAAISIDGVIQP